MPRVTVRDLVGEGYMQMLAKRVRRNCKRDLLDELGDLAAWLDAQELIDELEAVGDAPHFENYMRELRSIEKPDVTRLARVLQEVR